MQLTAPIFFVMFCYGNILVSGAPNTCGYEDSECLTKLAQNNYYHVINGDYEGVPSSDPLHLDIVEVNEAEIKYTVRNAKLHGLSKCYTKFVKIEPDTKLCHYFIACDDLYIEGQYEMKGNMGSVYSEGQGDFKINYYETDIKLFEKLEQYVGDDKKLHARITDFTVDLDIRGNVTYDFKNLFNGDTAKSTAVHEYINTNGKEVNKALRQPLMHKFMSVLLKNVNVYFNVIPAEDVMPSF